MPFQPWGKPSPDVNGVVDSYLVASIGIVALSGVSLANNILAVYQAVFIALAVAVSSRLAQALGEGGSEGIGGTASESVKFTVLSVSF